MVYGVGTRGLRFEIHLRSCPEVTPGWVVQSNCLFVKHAATTNLMGVLGSRYSGQTKFVLQALDSSPAAKHYHHYLLTITTTFTVTTKSLAAGNTKWQCSWREQLLLCGTQLCPYCNSDKQLRG